MTAPRRSTRFLERELRLGQLVHGVAAQLEAPRADHLLRGLELVLESWNELQPARLHLIASTELAGKAN